MVTSDSESAVTAVHSLRQQFLFDGVAVGAFLTRIVRVYRDYLSTSVSSFVVKHIQEGRPPYIVNRFGKHSRRQTFDVQAFDGNHAEILHQPVRQLVLKVSPLVPNVLVRLLQQQHCFMTTLRLFVWASCYLALCSTKLCLRCFVVAMILDSSTVGQSFKRFQSDINNDVSWVLWKFLRLEFNGEACIPASGFTRQAWFVAEHPLHIHKVKEEYYRWQCPREMSEIFAESHKLSFCRGLPDA